MFGRSVLYTIHFNNNFFLCYIKIYDIIFNIKLSFYVHR